MYAEKKLFGLPTPAQLSSMSMTPLVLPLHIPPMRRVAEHHLYNS